MREIYLPAFEKAVKQAQPWTVMACYNRVQGVYCTQSAEMLSRKLKREWGFEGIVISDWDAVIDSSAYVPRQVREALDILGEK